MTRVVFIIATVVTILTALAVIGCSSEPDNRIRLPEATPTPAPTPIPTPTTTPIPVSKVDIGKIAFIGVVEENQLWYNLWLINSDGSGKIQLSSDAIPLVRPSWSPSGDKLAVNTWNEPNPDSYMTYVDVFDLAGNLLARIDSVSEPSWSPDGNSIIYAAYYDGIYEYNLSTGVTRKIVNSRGKVFDHNPVWSPDGKKLVFVHHEYGTDYTVSLINFDETKIPYKGENWDNNVLNEDFTLIDSGESGHDAYFGFQWTPDSRKLIFATEPATIYVYDVPTGSLLKIQPENPYRIDAEDVDLSNDGQQIAFCHRGGLYLVDIDGSDMRRINNDWKIGDVTSGIHYIKARYPRWSHDDQLIAFASIPQYGIFLVNADGSGLMSVPNTEETLVIAWSNPIR